MRAGKGVKWGRECIYSRLEALTVQVYSCKVVCVCVGGGCSGLEWIIEYSVRDSDANRVGSIHSVDSGCSQMKIELNTK